MKKITLLTVSVFLFLISYNSNSINNHKNTIEINETINNKKPYYKGFKDGWSEGWKDVKGKYSYPPYAPYPSYPSYPKSVDSYKDGYNDGFKAGRKKALKS